MVADVLEWKGTKSFTALFAMTLVYGRDLI